MHLCRFPACVISLLILSSVLSSLLVYSRHARPYTHARTHSHSLAHKLAVDLITSDRMVQCPSRAHLTAHQHQLMDILSPTFISSKRQLPVGNWENECLECSHRASSHILVTVLLKQPPKMKSISEHTKWVINAIKCLSEISHYAKSPLILNTRRQ